MIALPRVRSRIASADPNLLVYNWTTLEERIGLNLLPNRAAALLGGVLGILALGLSTMGTYGATAFTTRQRAREIGIRIALGAPPSNVVGLVTQHGIGMIGVGLGLGLVGALASTTLLRHFLYGISRFDPAALIGLTLLLATTAYLACYIPARRASRVDPAVVLHDG
jgi:ABC-type antimicrobial peptide transport system permease subunit